MFVRSIHKPDAAAPRPAATVGLRVCQVPGCSREIPRRQLMCREHWFEVPAGIRNEVEGSLAAWLGHKQDVRPYLIARLSAIIHVERLHGDKVPDLEAQLARWTRSTETQR